MQNVLMTMIILEEWLYHFLPQVIKFKSLLCTVASGMYCVHSSSLSAEFVNISVILN